MKKPVTSIILVLLYFLFLNNSLELADCTRQSFTQNVLHAFIHANIGHLLVNSYSFLNLSNMESKYGSTNYLILLISLLILSAFIMYLFGIQQVVPVNTCAVGFSAVVLGLITFQNLMMNEFDFNQLRELALLLIVPFLKNPRVSLVGHFSGILAGVILSSLVNFFFKRKS